MSSYLCTSIHPISGLVLPCQMIDDYFGNHVYGAVFKDEYKVYNTDKYNIERVDAPSVEGMSWGTDFGGIPDVQFIELSGFGFAYAGYGEYLIFKNGGDYVGKLRNEGSEVVGRLKNKLVFFKHTFGPEIDNNQRQYILNRVVDRLEEIV